MFYIIINNNIMSYFNYHAKVKQKIQEGKLVTFKIVDKYNSISPAMVLYFSDGKVMPIRQHRWDEYFDLISKIK